MSIDFLSSCFGILNMRSEASRGEEEDIVKADVDLSKVSSWADFFFKEFPVSIKEFKTLIGKLGPVFNIFGVSEKIDALLGSITNLNQVYLCVKEVATHGHNVWVKEIGSPEFKFALVSVAAKVLYLSLCVFSIVAQAGGAVSSAILLSALFGLVCTAHFYKKLHIEKKEAGGAEVKS